MIFLVVVPVVLIAVPWWLRRRYIVVTVDGTSMEPAYRHEDRVLVRRVRAGRVRCGQVVVLAGTADEMRRQAVAAGLTPEMAPSGDAPETADHPDQGPDWMIKRAVAVPGDPVPRDEVPSLRHAAESVVPAGHLVVTGDNTAHSYDSRHFGYVSADRLLGVVLRRMG